MEEIERKSTKKEEIFFHTLVLLPQLAWPFVLRLVLSPLSFFPILIWRLLSSGAQGASGHPTAYKIAFFSSSFDAFVFFFFFSLSFSIRFRRPSLLATDRGPPARQFHLLYVTGPATYSLVYTQRERER